MAKLDQVLLRPLMTEKTSVDGEKYNRYAFLVQKGANKNQVRKPVEKYYDVKVLKVRTSITPGKLRMVAKSGGGAKVSKTPTYKKAIVQIEEGQKIEFFKGI